MQLLDLFDHMTWADAEVWTAVDATPAAAHDEPLHRLLAHIHLVQRVFLEAWSGVTPVWRQPSDFPSLAAVREFAAPYPAEARAYINGLDEAQLGRTTVLPWDSYMEGQLGRTLNRATLGETIMQVLTHSGYHRGQVNARLRAIGGTPPLVDYVAWVWFGKPAPKLRRPTAFLNAIKNQESKIKNQKSCLACHRGLGDRETIRPRRCRRTGFVRGARGRDRRADRTKRRRQDDDARVRGGAAPA
jgi:uncharacterized damage-inducible protein DinB